MFKLNYKTTIHSAHKLDLDYESECQNLHGHSYKIEFSIESSRLNRNSMVIDFSELKAIAKKLDHKNINDVIDGNPTAEKISEWLYHEVRMGFRSLPSDLKVKIKVWETPTASVTYYENL